MPEKFFHGAAYAIISLAIFFFPKWIEIVEIIANAALAMIFLIPLIVAVYRYFTGSEDDSGDDDDSSTSDLRPWMRKPEKKDLRPWMKEPEVKDLRPWKN